MPNTLGLQGGCVKGTLDFLNSNSGALQVLFAGVVAVATVFYAILTRSLVRETKRMRRAQTDAKVVMGLEPRSDWLNWIEIYVRNEGVGPATAVTFAVTMSDPSSGDAALADKIRSFGFVDKGLNYMSPRQEIRSFFTSLTEDFELKMSTVLNIDVSWINPSGDITRDRYVLDLSIFRGRSQLGEPDMHTIAKSLKKLQEDLHRVATGHDRLQVITQDKDDLRAEERERHLEYVEESERRRLHQAEGPVEDNVSEA